MSIIQGTLVNFDESLLYLYGKVLESLKNVLLWWANSNNVIKSDNIISIAIETPC